MLRRWTEVFFRLLGSGGAFTEEQRAELFGEMREMIEYCRDFVAERRRNPREDLATRLIFATADDGTPRLNDVELCSIILSLFTAGNETSASMIAQTLHCLLANPRQWTEVRADPSLILPGQGHPADRDAPGADRGRRHTSGSAALPTDRVDRPG